MTTEISHASPFSRETIETLGVMGLGPVWLLRETEDPLAPAPLHQTPLPQALQTQPPARSAAPAASGHDRYARQPSQTAPVPQPAPAPVQPIGMSDELKKQVSGKLWGRTLDCSEVMMCWR